MTTTPGRPSTAPDSIDPDVQREYDLGREKVALRAQLEVLERPFKLANDVSFLLGAARGAIDKAEQSGLEGGPSKAEEYAEQAAALCEMAVEKCLAWAVAELEHHRSGS